MNQDAQHLELLKTFHYVLAGVLFLFGLFPVVHLVFGIVMVASPQALDGGHGQPPPAFLGWLFIGVGLFVMAAFLSLAGATLAAGRRLAARRSYTFCLVVAALLCLFMPLGTLLGVFTIVVLMRPTVKPLFSS